MVASSSLVTPSEKFRGYIPGLDILRAVGIWVVMLNHTFPPDVSGALTNALNLGWAFMDSFFVMSGFLITGILLDTKGRQNAFRNFLMRRALRILPAYYAVLAVLLLLHALLNDEPSAWGTPMWFLVYLGNLPTAISGEWPGMLGGALIPLWSLQIEEQYYLLFPMLVLFASTRVLRNVLVALIPVSLGLRIVAYILIPENELIQYVSLPLRMEGFALGGLIAIRYRNGPWVICGRQLNVAVVTLLIATALIGMLGGWHHTGPLIRTVGFLASSLASAAMVVWFIENRGSRGLKIIDIGPMRYTGKISYGLYLVHFPIRTATDAFFPYHSGWEGVVFSAAVIAASFLVAALSWHFLEEPMIRKKAFWSSSR